MATTLKYSEVRAWLEAQPENTASTPYEIIITGIQESNFSLNFSGRYVAIAGLEMQSGVTELGPIFFNCHTLVGSVTIPEGVTVIGQRAFAGCYGLTNVNIPNSVTTISGDAFWDCPGLTSINIPDSVKTIGMGAFRNSVNLASAAIPDGATYVHCDAFYGCTSLQYMDTYYLPTKSGKTFLCKKIPKDTTDFYFRGDCVGISAEAFQDCTSLTGVVIPDVKTICDMAFQGCTSLTSVYMYPDFSSILIKSDSFSGTPSTLNLYVPARKLPAWKSATLTNYGFASGVVAKMLPPRKWIRVA